MEEIEHVLNHSAGHYAGSRPGNKVVEGQTATVRPIAVVYSELHDSRGVVDYVVTVYPIGRFRDDASLV